MASAFWGGFADTMLQGRLRDQEAQREIDKEQRLAELKRKYEGQIVDSQLTQIVGNEEIRYNKFGEEMFRRALSAEELAVRKAAVDKGSAEARRAVTEADMSDYTYGNREEDRRMSLEDRTLERAVKQAQIDQGWRSLDISAARNRDDRQARQDDRVFLDVQKNYNEVVAALEQVGPETLQVPGISSGQSLAAAALAEIDGFIEAGNYVAANRALAALRGKLRNSVISAESAARDTSFSNLGGTGGQARPLDIKEP